VADDVMDKAAADTNPVSANGVGTSVAKRPESRADRARRVAYRNRFAAFFVVLAVVAGAGVGALMVLVGRGSPEPTPAWSAWEPTGTADQRVAQIADHVSHGYRLPSGNALVAITYQGPPVGTSEDGTLGAVRAIAVRPDTTGGRADASDIATLDARNAAWADELEALEGRRERDTPGAGAAGGVGFGLLAAQGRFRSFALRPGIDLVMEATDFPARLARADLVITGEGRIDAQTGFGKTALGVAKRAAAAGVPCIAVGGGVEVDGIRALAEIGAIAVPVVERPMAIEDAMASGIEPLERCGERLARLTTLW